MNPVEEIVLNLISSYKPEDLEYAASRDISLVELIIKYLPEPSIRLIRFFAGLYRSEKELFTPKNILIWLKENRSDLAEVIENNPEVKAWFRNQVREIKKFLWP